MCVFFFFFKHKTAYEMRISDWSADVCSSDLLRTEFMYMNRPDLPDEEEQYQVLSEIVRAMQGLPVTVRTLDIGGEKLATSLGEQLGVSVNPALGLRAI